jgi:hypothetical protein
MNKALGFTMFAAFLAACSEGTGPGGAQISLSFSTQSPGAVSASPGMSLSSVAGAPITDGQNELLVTKAEIVLREIELKRVETVDCDSAVDEDACEEFETGPMLLNPPLDGQTEVAVTIPIDPGSYDELEFEIHKVSGDDSEDATFVGTHPQMADLSIRMEGTFNGASFTYETDLDVEQEFDLPEPIVIDENTVTTNVTVRMDIGAWFRDGSGTLVNPALGNKGGAFESLVKENIKQNIEAFEDRDGDGDDQDEG